MFGNGIFTVYMFFFLKKKFQFLFFFPKEVFGDGLVKDVTLPISAYYVFCGCVSYILPILHPRGICISLPNLFFLVLKENALGN